MRNIRDYVVKTRPGSQSFGSASPFNISADTMTLANFTKPEISELYRQHTAATGRVFEDSAIERSWRWSSGQHWLVNALARRILEKLENEGGSAAITAELMDQAADELLKRQDAHLDSLLNLLQEPRIIRVMDKVFSGNDIVDSAGLNDEIQLCLDLGLVIKNEFNNLTLANRIYQHYMVKHLSDGISSFLEHRQINELSSNQNIWIKNDRILVDELISEFLLIWRKFGSSFPLIFEEGVITKYYEATYAFIMYSFFLSISNRNGAMVELQSASGRGRVDICITYKKQEYIIELKVNSTKYPFNKEDSLIQLARYLDNNGVKEGWLIVFEQNRSKNWDERYFRYTEIYQGLTIHIIGC